MSFFQIILLAVFGASAVAGVLIFAILTSTNLGSSIGPVTVWGTFDDATFQAIIRALGENEPRLKSVTYVRRNEETYEKDLTDALAAGTGPDAFFIRNDYAYTNASKISTIPYESFSRQQFQDMFVEGASPFLTPEGVLAIPVMVDPFVLYWNRDTLSTGGFASPPVFWDEVFNMARVMTKRTDSGTITDSALAFGEFVNVSHAKQLIGMLIMQAGGPITTRDVTGALNPSLVARTGEVVRPADSAVAFFTDFANPSNDFYSWNRAMPASRTAFSNGDLALYFGPSSEELLMRRSNPNLNFAVAPMPQIKNIDKDVSAGYVYALAVPKAAPNPSGGLTTAYLLGSLEASRAIATAFGRVSARRDAIALTTGCYECLRAGGSCAQEQQNSCRAGFESIDGEEYLYARQALLVRNWEDPNPQETEKIFKDMIESVTSGAARVSEAVQRAELAMRQLVAP